MNLSETESSHKDAEYAYNLVRVPVCSPVRYKVTAVEIKEEILKAVPETVPGEVIVSKEKPSSEPLRHTPNTEYQDSPKIFINDCLNMGLTDEATWKKVIKWNEENESPKGEEILWKIFEDVRQKITNKLQVEQLMEDITQ